MKSKYTELNSFEWLSAKYLDEKRSTVEIAQIVGAKEASSVRHALKSHGIKVRSRGDGHRAAREDTHFVPYVSVLDGCLLGDGGMKIENPESLDSLPVFCKRNIYLDHVTYVCDLLFAKQHRERIKLRDSGGKEIYEFSTLSEPSLLSFYRRWYPSTNGFKKLVPRDLVIDKVALLHWFMDDGYSYMVKPYGRGKKTSIRVYFCTQSFTKDDCDFLCEKLQTLGLKAYSRFHQRNGLVKGTGYEVEISTPSIPDFFKVIGPCPVNSMQYKWKLDY